MTATAHALVGGAIASSIQNPALGVALSTVSHPFLDMVPHWDFGWNWREKAKTTFFLQASFDLVFGFTLAYFLFGQSINFWYFSLAVFGSLVWDIVESPYWFFNWRFPPFSWIYNVQSRIQGKLALPWGIVTQVVAVAAIIIILNSL